MFYFLWDLVLLQYVNNADEHQHGLPRLREAKNAAPVKRCLRQLRSCTPKHGFLRLTPTSMSSPTAQFTVTRAGTSHTYEIVEPASRPMELVTEEKEYAFLPLWLLSCSALKLSIVRKWIPESATHLISNRAEPSRATPVFHIPTNRHIPVFTHRL